MVVINYPRRKKHNKNIVFFLLLQILILFPFSLLHGKENLETVTLQLKWFHQFQFAGYYAAIEKGFYAEEGLSVILKENDPSKSTIPTVIDREADYGVADASLLLQRMLGHPVVLMKQIFQHSPLILISPEKSGIISPYEMAGKSVMFDPEEDASILALFMETIGGVEKIRIIPPSDSYDDFAKGKVDVLAAYLTDAPYLFRQQGLNVNIINPQNYGIDFYGDNLFTTEHEIKNHPDRVEKMIRASIKGWEYALEHPQELVEIIKTKYSSKLSREQLEFEARMTALMILRDLIPIGDIRPERYEKIGEIYKRLGMVDDYSMPEGFIYQKETPGKSAGLTDEERKWLKDHPDIKLGISGKLEPYIIANADGTQSGILKEFIDTINKRLGTDISIEAGEWIDILEKSRNKSIEGVLALKDENADKLGLLKTNSYFTAYPVVFSRGDNKFKTIDDLVGKKVSILEENYYQDEILETYRKKMKIIKVSNSLEALQMVYEGKVDATIGLSSFNYLITKYHLSGLAPSFIMWDHPINAVIGIRSDWPELVNILNKGIDSFTEDELNGIVSKWYSLPVKPQGIKLTGPEQTYLQKNSKIRVGIDPYWAPIEYIDEEGDPLGISVDFLNRISSVLNISFEFASGDSWYELLDKMDKKEVDLFPAMVKTEKREENFAFTNPYISFPIVIFAKKGMHFIGDLKELNGKKVAVARHYAIDEYLTKDYPDIELIRKKNELETIIAVQKGEADFTIGNLFTVSTQISNLGDPNLDIVGETPYSYDLCFALRKDMAPLVPIIQKAMDSITEPEKNEIRSKWISVGYRHAFDYSLLWKGAIVVSIIIIWILLWNRHLSREVAKRTKALELNKRVVTNTSIGTVVFHASGQCIVANEAAATLVGGTVKEILKLDFHQIREWQETGLLTFAERALESEREQTGEISTTTTFGKKVTLHCRFIPFRFKEEPHLLMMFEDISERKEAEEALEKSEQKYRTLFNSASDGILLMEGNHFIDCSDRALEIYGWDRQDLIGKTPIDYSPEKQPDGSSSIEKAEKVIREALKGNRQFFEWRHKRKDGTMFDAEITLNAIDIGKENSILAIVRDVTERKKAEEAIRVSEARQSLILGSLPLAFYVAQPFGDYGGTWVSDQIFDISGFKPEEFLKNINLWASRLHPDDRDQTLSAFDSLREKKKISVEYRWQKADGNYIWIEDNSVLVRDKNGKPKEIIGTWLDISDRKKAKETEAEKNRLSGLLQQAQKMEAIGTLAGGIAHDFNNILSSIFGYCELAKMDLVRGEDVEDNLDEVLKGAGRAKNLVKHILTFSRQTSIEKTPTALRPLIKETLKFIRSSIPATIEVKYDLGNSDLKVMADPTQIHQITMNLCTNAAHAMKDKGGILDVRLCEVEITDEATIQYKEIKEGKYLQLTVADSGTGIEKRVIDRIFDPFFTTKERGEGTGLGLSVIHGIVKDMEGAISVYSEPGTGTTFQVLLPEYEGELAETTSEHVNFIKGEGRILFVDDEKAIIDSGKKILERQGYEVVSTTSSTRALEIFEKQPDKFDLVLTDMTMPKMTGLELARELKEIRPDIPIILCTGYSLALTEAMIRENGIEQMIMKPIISSELAIAINEVLNSSEK